MEKHVTSLALSQKLKEAGVAQKSEFYWKKTIFNGEEAWGLRQFIEPNYPDHACASAFLASELGELLPEVIEYPGDRHTYWLTITHETSGWNVAYQTREDRLGVEKMEDTMPETMGDMLLYLIQNKLLVPTG